LYHSFQNNTSDFSRLKGENKNEEAARYFEWSEHSDDALPKDGEPAAPAGPGIEEVHQQAQENRG
jgi:hypothetical protein